MQKSVRLKMVVPSEFIFISINNTLVIYVTPRKQYTIEGIKRIGGFVINRRISSDVHATKSIFRSLTPKFFR